ncbi:fructosamine kinase [Metarhizium robertsii]|uniref:protein-ribulosamine 3-kinase n=2 Tax=Metarhizium robertsii TaxID=568076 RepID=E9EU43_METRA|nr:Fructosamine/Ketosamine-3-kinase [Metarhizium robertsii ARSEF 23]EFZ00946.1 Fructosamine/Ketosamine-3-kinase [Metarhizium robertsii ARSEF 23]EXV03481.1 fructosamine kinase [Metarhizium robertsii]
MPFAQRCPHSHFFKHGKAFCRRPISLDARKALISIFLLNLGIRVISIRRGRAHLDFPPGSKVKDTRSHGASFWTRTARIDIELPDKTQKAYFLKVSTSELGALKPVALHADIWYGNLATNAATGEPVYFDPSVFWGHNEYDVGSMDTPRYRLGRHWMREYHKFFPISAPEEDYEARKALYAI